MSILDSKKILILGKNGQIGSAIYKKLYKKNIIAPSSKDFNLANTFAIIPFLEKYQPEIIINCAAYTKVDLAESEKDMARKINTDAVQQLAQWAYSNHSLLVHYSTDYVFDGYSHQIWSENSPTTPINFYGQTKLESEKAIKESLCPFLIFRTSWVYNEAGNNFLTTMLELSHKYEELKIVNDQVGSPSYAPRVAEFTLEALEFALNHKETLNQIYHLTNTGQTNWYEFALNIFELQKQYENHQIKHVHGIPSSNYPTQAKRPLYSKLSTKKFEQTFQAQLPHWKDDLQICMENKFNSRK